MFKTFLLLSNIMVSALSSKKKNVGLLKYLITPDFIGKKFYIILRKTGKIKVISITRLHVGHFFGEFIKTRTCEHAMKLRHKIKAYEHNSKQIRISK